MKKCMLLIVAVICLAVTSLAQEGSSNIHRTARSLAPPPSAQIYYAGGPIMSGSTNVYVIYYGTWPSTSQSIVNTWLSHIGGTGLYNINTTYHDSTGAGVQNVVHYTSSTNSYNDNYSLGKSLTDASIQTIVSNAIAAHHLPADVNGVYFVLTATDVNQSAFGGSLCGTYCGYHSPSTSIVSGDIIKYSIVGNSAKCPSACDGNIVNADTTSPNGDVGADGAISVIYHELSETVSDPNYGISGAWGAGVSGESGDLCAWNFGTWSTLPRASNGSHYNVTISSFNYLIQQMFQVSVPRPVSGTYYTGSCAINLGTGTASVSPTSENFGTRYQNDPPVNKTVTLTNTGTSTITITSIGASLSAPYTVTGTTCGSTLGAGLNCSITVTFRPADAAIGVNKDTLSIVDSAVNSPQNVALTGTMRCPPAGCL
jgi:hypothetical protein